MIERELKIYFQDLSWEPPRKVNGQLSQYILRVKYIDKKNDHILDQRDYCQARKEIFLETVGPLLNLFSNSSRASRARS